MKKTSSTKAILLAVLIVLGMIVSPVCAAQYTPKDALDPLNTVRDSFLRVYNVSWDGSPQGHAIGLINFQATTNYPVVFTLYYGNGTAVSGSMESYPDSLLWTRSIITLGGISKSYAYLNNAEDREWFVNSYGWNGTDDQDTGFLLYSTGYGRLDNDLAVFYPVPSITTHLIYRIDASSTAPFDIHIDHGVANLIAQQVAESPVTLIAKAVDFVTSNAGMILGICIGVVVWLKFLFVDNLFLVVALYISVSMAYSAISSRNIFQFYRKFFQFQRSMLEFVVTMWNYIVQIISSFRGIFRL